jgi:hypothetical protein
VCGGTPLDVANTTSTVTFGHVNTTSDGTVGFAKTADMDVTENSVAPGIQGIRNYDVFITHASAQAARSAGCTHAFKGINPTGTLAPGHVNTTLTGAVKPTDVGNAGASVYVDVACT